MHYQTITVAVDVADEANGRAALARAATIAGTAGRIRLLYVRHYLPTRYGALLGRDFDLEEQEEAMAIMTQWMKDAGLTEDRAVCLTRRGRIRDEVIKDAEQSGADLIVIGSHQPSLSSRLLGSNASAIVHQSPVSVLVSRM